MKKERKRDELYLRSEIIIVRCGGNERLEENNFGNSGWRRDGATEILGILVEERGEI